jgi:plastocyanin
MFRRRESAVRHRIVLILVFIGAALAVAPAASASGGGACPPPITKGSGSAAVIQGFCFKPTVLYVEPGTSVTWDNEDWAEHSVTGANRAFGSYKVIRADRSATFSFEKPGVYPYYCILHPGMVGAVVVEEGDATEAVAASKPRRAAAPPWQLGIAILGIAILGGRLLTRQARS